MLPILGVENVRFLQKFREKPIFWPIIPTRRNLFLNDIISWDLINNEQQRKFKKIAWSFSKMTFNDDKWQKLACSLAPACDDKIFFQGQK